MKVLLVVGSFPPEIKSSAALFFELAQGLTQGGHQVMVVTPVPRRHLASGSQWPGGCHGFLSHIERLHGIQVIRVVAVPFAGHNLVMRALDAVVLPLTMLIGCLHLGKPDVVLVYSPPLTLGLTGWALSRIRGVPFILNVQDIYPQTLTDLGLLKSYILVRALEAMERFVYAKATRIVVHSKGNQGFLVKMRLQPEEKVVVIPNWVDTKTIQPGEKFNGFRQEHQLGKKFVVLFAGTMGYAQDLGSVIKAADLLRENKNILFLLVGDGVREAEWKEKAVALRLRNVHFLPLQPMDVYPFALNASDVGLVLLSGQLRTPAVPAKLQSIMASGRPVIASVSPESDACRIIEEAGCGYLVEPGNEQMLARAVLKLYENPGLAVELGANARLYAERHFSLAICAETYSQLFQELF